MFGKIMFTTTVVAKTMAGRLNSILIALMFNLLFNPAIAHAVNRVDAIK